MKLKIISVFIFIIILFVSCTEETKPEVEMIKKKIDQYVPTTLQYDESLLDGNQKIVVDKLYKASKIMDRLFLKQVYKDNLKIENELKSRTDAEGKLLYEYFKINFGPFDRLDHNKPFYGSVEKPEGANFYPQEVTKNEFEQWIKNHPEDEKAFTSEFTIIRKDNDKLIAVPYSEFYKDDLSEAAALLKEAAEYADNKTLKNYLEKRADAFLSNDYYESDMAWMDLKDHKIEIVIGPYEVYEDEMFNYKASFESFLTIVDPGETEKLKVFASYLNDMEANLPIPEKHKNFNRGSESPIMVVQEVFSAGDTKAGVQTLAFNLPNDERVRKAKGSKKVMLKNMHEAKFEKLLYPIAELILKEDQLKYVTFDAFFNHTLMHEMSHGIGPGFIKVNGKDTEVKKELKETYSKIEECKADILGMFNNIFMIEKGIFSKDVENEIWVTFLAGVFRSVRFGINEAHGGGNAIIYNYMLENGAYNFDEQSQTVSVNFDKAYPVLKSLAEKLLMIQAEGNYDGSVELINQYGVETSSMKILREKLSILPIDIKPVFQIEE